MNWRNGLDIKDLVRRFDAGERGKVLLAHLNRAAFDCFHAPWETLPPPKTPTKGEGDPGDLECILSADEPDLEVPPLHRKQGRLPMEASDEGQKITRKPETDEESEEKTDGPGGGNPNKSEVPKDPDKAPEDPMGRLDEALEALGFRGHRSKSRSLIVGLPYDARSDSQGQMIFRADPDHQCFQVRSHGDLVLSRISEADLERICRVHNQRDIVMVAKAYRPAEGARLRLRLVATLPYDLTRSQAGLTNCISDLIQRDRLFWRHVRRCLPV